MKLKLLWNINTQNTQHSSGERVVWNGKQRNFQQRTACTQEKRRKCSSVCVLWAKRSQLTSEWANERANERMSDVVMHKKGNTATTNPTSTDTSSQKLHYPPHWSDQRNEMNIRQQRMKKHSRRCRWRRIPHTHRCWFTHSLCFHPVCIVFATNYGAYISVFFFHEEQHTYTHARNMGLLTFMVVLRASSSLTHAEHSWRIGYLSFPKWFIGIWRVESFG